MTLVIETDQLTRKFGERTAVDHLTLNIHQGEVFGMLGPNGAGKTTTVRLLNGLLTPTGGSTRILGLNPVTHGEKVRAQTGVLTESPSVYEQLTARDNLRIFAGLYQVPRNKIAARVDLMLETFGLTARANEKVGGFSKGMKQRLALARVLVHDPQIVFLDEPTSALDPEAARQVSDLIATLSREHGRTVLLATHDLNDAQRLCDRVAVMNKGRVLALGTPTELAQTLWNTVWLDVRLKQPPAFIDKLRTFPDIYEVLIDGDSLAIQLSSEDAIPQVVTAIVHLGGLITRVTPREHSLEEVYFTLQKRAAAVPLN